uniref:Centrosomal protein 83 n=1 Tax=Tetraodon nigroviridis TaxID=99883 RepID=H3C7X6_TETNG
GREGELQKMLIEERIHSENFRTKYYSLKEETTRLQEEFIQAQDEIKHLLSDRQSLQDTMSLQMVELQRSLLAKTKEAEELRQQTMSPLQQEMLKVEQEMLKAGLQQEINLLLREMCRQLEEEVEKYRSGYNQVRYECIGLQSQLEQQRGEHAHGLESQRLLHQAETSVLQKDKEELVARLQGFLLRSDEKKLEALLKERVQLKVRLQGLEAEVAELHAQKESLSQQAENAQSVQNRQLTESQALLKSLEAERESMRLQLEKVREELELSNEENCQLSRQLHGAERQVSSLTCQIENLRFSHKQEVNSIKVDFTLSQGELEKERNKLQGQIEGGSHLTEIITRSNVIAPPVLLHLFEREMCRKVQSVRDEEFRKTVQLQQEKLDLENRLSSVQQQTSLKAAATKERLAEWEERLSDAKHREVSASQELQDLRTKVQQQSSQILELERFKGDLVELQRRNDRLDEQLRKASSSEEEQRKRSNKELQETLERVREELKTTQVQAERVQQEAERKLQDCQTEWTEERRNLRQKYSEAKEKMQRAAAAQKKRKTLTETKERKLQNKIQLLEAQLETLELEVSAAKRNLSFCEQAHKRKIKDLLRRHREFQSVLFEGGFKDVPRITTSSIRPFDPRAEELPPNTPAEQHQEIDELWRRTDHPEQLEELATVPA